tara:strand:+ start:1183 stop:1773 length:591 start_codon:yes stop_codon:yes gene_type:complete
MGHMGCHKMAAIWGWDVTLTKYTNPAYLKKSKRGTAKCELCKNPIKERSHYWKFEVAFKPKRIRCEEHPFRMSDKAQGRNAEVYAVQEYLEDWINGVNDAFLKGKEIDELLECAKTDLDRIAEEYEDGIMNTISELQQEESQEKVDKIRAGIDLIDETLSEIKDTRLTDCHNKLCIRASRDEQESYAQQIIDEVAI